MSNTKYAFATGGTPITTWLINQIEAVLEYERVIINFVNDLKFTEIITELPNYNLWLKLKDEHPKKRELLLDQVNELKNNNYDINLVYMKNIEMNLEDKNL